MNFLFYTKNISVVMSNTNNNIVKQPVVYVQQPKPQQNIVNVQQPPQHNVIYVQHPPRQNVVYVQQPPVMQQAPNNFGGVIENMGGAINTLIQSQVQPNAQSQHVPMQPVSQSQQLNPVKEQEKEKPKQEVANSENEKGKTENINTESTSKKLTKKQKFRWLQIYISLILQLIDFITDILVLSNTISRYNEKTNYCSSTYYDLAPEDEHAILFDSSCVSPSNSTAGYTQCNADNDCRAALSVSTYSVSLTQSYCSSDCECCANHYYLIIMALWSTIFALAGIKELFRMIYGLRIGLSAHIYTERIDETAPRWMTHLHGSFWIIFVKIWNPQNWSRYVEIVIMDKLRASKCNIFMELLMETIPSTVLVIVDSAITKKSGWQNILSLIFSCLMILYTLIWKVRKSNQEALERNKNVFYR
eukprot:445125_1